MTKSQYNAPSSPLFKEMHTLKLKDLCDSQILNFMYGFVNQNLPKPLLSMFELNRDIHSHATRQSTDPRPPKSNSYIMNNSFLCKGPRLWSELDHKIKVSKTKSSFKKRTQTLVKPVSRLNKQLKPY